MSSVELIQIQEAGICRGKDPDLFFDKETRSAAICICHKCPIETECREYAIHYERDGVWGGTTPGERDRIRRLRKILLPPLYDGAYRAQRTTPRKAEP